ncbi:MAG: hypothetical protein DHS20C11_06250 [Lysobacteraceae bacterium]|nr:MAG: hypothetical protein DHS20C11_06250 [Xanthomonadaceae bacterium]
MRRNTPQSKKVLDYVKRRENCVGENTKNSRKAIHKRKRWVNRAYRKAVNNILSNSSQQENEFEQVENIQRHGWRKYPDQLSIEAEESKWAGSSRFAAKPNRSPLRKEAIKRLRRSKVGTDL